MQSLSQPFKTVSVLFRKEVKKIPSTTFGNFSIIKYPAKFIPQVIAYVLEEYSKPKMKIFDPFSGYGTVGLVSRLYDCNYEMWDLNPMLSFIHRSATWENWENVDSDWRKILCGMQKDRSVSQIIPEFIPQWSNLNYWVPAEFLHMLCQAWGVFHSLPENQKPLLCIPLLKLSRYFSYSDEKIHKLYRSKHAKKKVSQLLVKDWESYFYQKLEVERNKFLYKIKQQKTMPSKTVQYTLKEGIDSLEHQLDQEVDILISSPPYLQAQEYIRSTKLELFWLGYI